MLARRTKIYFKSEVIAETPLLLPSFSSKGFPEVKKILKLMSGFITSGILVSAYDIYYKKISPSALTFPDFVFLDSGGYEARVDHDLSETYGRAHKPNSWTQKKYIDTLKKWRPRRPTIAISFDSPKHFSTLKQQIANAKQLQDKFPDLLIELIVKPETSKSRWIPVQGLIKRAKELRVFSALGLSEKELDESLMGRMTKISALRTALDEAGVTTPIHIFGSLDTLSTPLYFLSGAEIFDGLTWLRFGYSKGHTIYEQNYGAFHVANGLLRKSTDLTYEMWKDNYYYLERMRTQMINCIRKNELLQFDHISDVLGEAYKHLQAANSKVG